MSAAEPDFYRDLYNRERAKRKALEAKNAELRKQVDILGTESVDRSIADADRVWLTRDEAKEIRGNLPHVPRLQALLDERLGNK